ncbi:MAG: hypothetical protein IJX72_07670 [Clostridia bacterium]|nr:hypothetical protein [Clostridia bacterium]
MDRKNLVAEYRAVQREIQLYTRGKYRASYFLRHVLCFFRLHPELYEQSDYRELYDETVTLLILEAHAINHWTKHSPTDQQGWIEFLSDLANRNLDGNFEFFSEETIDGYLAYRKKRWASGQKYTKEWYGFIT